MKDAGQKHYILHGFLYKKKILENTSDRAVVAYGPVMGKKEERREGWIQRGVRQHCMWQLG